jgi:hypothetical protein
VNRRFLRVGTLAMAALLASGPAIAQDDRRLFAGGLFGVSTLQADGSAVITASSAALSLYKPENGLALNLFAGCATARAGRTAPATARGWRAPWPAVAPRPASRRSAGRCEKNILDDVIGEIHAWREALPDVPIHRVDVRRNESCRRFPIPREDGRHERPIVAGRGDRRDARRDGIVLPRRFAIHKAGVEGRGQIPLAGRSCHDGRRASVALERDTLFEHDRAARRHVRRAR